MRWSNSKALHVEVERLVAIATASASGTRAIEVALCGWTVEELLAADELIRRSWADYRVHDAPTLVSAVAAGVREATWLASMSRDGYLRERAVRAMADDPSAAVDRLLAVRLDDFVEVVREAAWEGLTRRLTQLQAAVVVPVLVALRRRHRSFDALDRYVALYQEATGRDPGEVLVGSSDRQARRWAFDRRIDRDALTVDEALRRLPIERDQHVAVRLVDLVTSSNDATAIGSLLASKHANARAKALMALPCAALPPDQIALSLMDKAARVRGAARVTAARCGLNAVETYLHHWGESKNPRALLGAAESGVHFPTGQLLALLGDTDARIRNVALTLLARAELAPADVGVVLALVDDPRSAPSATRVLAGSFAWRYDDVAPLWATADGVKRRRLWRLLSSRGGWDRVRASVLAATDPDPAVAGQGLADLRGWQEHTAARMWRGPTPEQRSDLLRDLAIAAIPHGLREAIEFRAGFPVTPRPDAQFP